MASNYDQFNIEEDSSNKINKTLKALQFSNPGAKFSNAVETLGKRKTKGINKFDIYINPSLYNENGVLFATGQDICDCLRSECVGCHFPCKNCKSPKCGSKCRVNRTWYYEKIEVDGLPCTFEMKQPN